MPLSQPHSRQCFRFELGEGLPLQHREASNTVYVGVKADPPIPNAIVDAAPSAD